ncbi:MAG TPA: hypothetical protein VFX20_15865 [Steroidobacteraceae bacterium]|nr:hypothetical protein [Steroidobacteraceae bacterium]
MIREVRGLAREHTEAAIAVLVGIAGDKRAPHSARVSASVAILDRAWGRPETSIALSRPPIDIAPGYTPMTAGEVANLYQDLVSGAVDTEDGLAALERAADNPPVWAHPENPEPKALVPVVVPFVPTTPPPPRVDETPADSPPPVAGEIAERPRRAARSTDEFDDAGCPTATALEAAQRRREEAAAEARRENEQRVEEQNARERAAAAERERRIAEEEA